MNHAMPTTTSELGETHRIPRSCLVVPASDSRKVEKALGTAADEVVLDLEDAVAPSAKDAARASAAEVLRAGPGRAVAVRINQIGTRWCHHDVLEMVAAAPGRLTLVVPKVESAADVGFIDRLVRGALADRSTSLPEVSLDVLVETAAALRDLDAVVTASPLVRAVVVGYADLGADLGRDAGGDPTLWDAVRHQVVTAVRAAGRVGLDGPWLSTAADAPFLRDRERARAFGLDGTWVIHPAQVAEATRIFSPSADEVAWARRVLGALDASVADGAGAVALDGQMLDEAVAVRARSVLAKAGGRLTS
ncbi:HpcH/HpaI aldolase/citrate lyase family protein [Trujillonella endophytica]|uniref:Citrate lyase subunit beta / citryl-CoA lyase n=1 Tax=Trujillonella endophytica TaxID=673521 RepID=A0A1H8QSG1_9ACTN|nr:CoA ester lyase [Trujillella endophytica]SEO57142.1 citrate lyase subunit beta / citryl-CoA lyase [Trujillella endophytica]